MLGVALAACETASADHAPGARGAALACLDSVAGGRDTLVFSDVVTADETYDATGTEVSLWRDGGAWAGAVREAEGELGTPRPFESLAFDAGTGAITLAYGNGAGDVFRFAGTLSCRSLSGRWRLYDHEVEAALPRVPHGGYTPPASARQADGEVPAEGSNG